MSRYYKLIDKNGDLLQIGKDDNTGIEITENEYMELYQRIQESSMDEELTKPID